MTDDSHVFGGEQTRIKLNAVGKYLPAYTTALSKQGFRLSYIDAFAGTGVCHIKVRGRQLLIPGSASIALNCRPPFQRIVFIEAKKRHADALERLKQSSRHGSIEIIRGDANDQLPGVLQRLNPRNDRAVVFLDPYGMSVAWETLVAAAETKAVDLWYLFPLSGLYRQAAKDANAIDPDKAAALTRMLGTDEWRQAFYARSPQDDLFSSEPTDVRVADVKQMTSWVTQRLRSIFPAVVEPKLLYQSLPNGKEGAPLFALYFAVANPEPKAYGLAMSIARDILKR